MKESFILLKEFAKVLKVDNKGERLDEYHNNAILMGSYEDWNKELDGYRQARFIQNLIIQYIDCKYYDYAKEAYEIVGTDEFTSNYFKRKIESII